MGWLNLMEALPFFAKALLDVGILVCLCAACFWETRLLTAFERKDRPELHKALLFFGITWMHEITFFMILAVFF